MSASGELIIALVAGGMDPAEAAGLVVRAAIEMTGALNKKSVGAARQQRWRERNKASQSVTAETGESVSNRNESVTRDAEAEASQTVSNRNEASQRNALSLSKEEKKEVIKEKRESRATQLPDDWRPPQKHWDEAVSILASSERAELELRKFKLHAADKGRVAKNWNAAWVKWAIQAIEYGARNGNGISNHRADPAAGRATAREAQHVAVMGSAALRYLQESKSAGQGGNTSGSTSPADILDFGKRSENAR